MPIAIPSPLDSAGKSWRKTVTAIDPAKEKGYAIQGEFIDAGAEYDLPSNGLLLGVDETPVGTIVTLWAIGDDGLTQVKQITRKGPWAGKATITAVSKLLAKHPWPVGFEPQRRTLTPNQRAGTCRRCRQTVQPGDGFQRRADGQFHILHRVCPPRPPRRNQYPGPCRTCNGWLDAQEGILVAGDTGLLLIHEETCPPAELRKPAPPEPNLYEEPCALCWLPVPAGEGVYAWRAVTHIGACPAGFAGPTWVVSYGRPGPYKPRPRGGYTIGQTLRITVGENTHAVPQDAPGHRRDRRGVSLIATVVAEAKPVYCRDDEGNQPADLIGDDGWFFQAKVRVATAEEAAPVLAAETERENADALRLRAQMDIIRAGDGETPPRADGLLDLPGVRVEHRRTGSLAFAASWGAYIHLRVDRAGGWVWALRYNGADGDNWSVNNAGPFVARRVPLTPERAELVDALAAEFGTIA